MGVVREYINLNVSMVILTIAAMIYAFSFDDPKEKVNPLRAALIPVIFLIISFGMLVGLNKIFS